jgi:hypothetical protein
MTELIDVADDDSALEWLHEHGCTDGLPVVIPTPERVARMVLAGGLDADHLIGTIGPMTGAATVERVATSAVMAGCLPDHFPVVLAVVRALCRPELDTGEWQSTTHAISPLIVVNGPARGACGPLAHGFGALGPGHRANVSIGRAVRLVLVNIGGARPGVTDMALLGQPGKLSMVVAEDEDASPFPPLHTSLDATMTADDSAVTVVGVEGPHSVISVGDADDPDAPERLLRSLASAIANVGSNNAHFRRGAVAVALNPDHATTLARAGLCRGDVQRRLHELAANPRSLLHALNPTFTPHPGDGLVRATERPEDIVVFQAGGGGLYSAVFPSWGAGSHANPWVVERIELDQACELPWARSEDVDGVTSRA